MTASDDEVGRANRPRRADDPARERRVGPSRLSLWSGRRLAVACIAWISVVLALVGIGMALSVVLYHDTYEIRLAVRRSNLIGLGAVLLLPPTWITLQWWMMRNRRQARRQIQS